MNDKRIKEWTGQFYNEYKALIPMSEARARAIRGIGRRFIEILSKLGYVKVGCYNGLSERARNILSRNGIETKQEAADAIRLGKLNPVSKHYGRKESVNYGLKTHREVCLWAGVEFVAKPKRVKICPHCGKPI